MLSLSFSDWLTRVLLPSCHLPHGDGLTWDCPAYRNNTVAIWRHDDQIRSYQTLKTEGDLHHPWPLQTNDCCRLGRLMRVFLWEFTEMCVYCTAWDPCAEFKVVLGAKDLMWMDFGDIWGIFIFFIFQCWSWFMGIFELCPLWTVFHHVFECLNISKVVHAFC